MARKRIRYMLRAFDGPSGGVQQIRRHVEALVASGHDAAVVIDSDKDAHFYDYDVPRIFERDFSASAGDICVVPEGWRKHALALSATPAELVCFCQNHHNLNQMFSHGESFRTFRIADVMCCSRQAANYVERYYDAERIEIVPCAVSQVPDVGGRKRLAVGFMPRKGIADVRVIHDIFRRKYPVHADVPWISIDGLRHAEAMTLLGSLGVFLSMSHREGFGLPPVEAMSAGALVVGFHGGGGLDYATPRNGLWCVEGDLAGCADALDDALTLLRSEGGEGRDMIVEGRRTAARYAPHTMAEALVSFWTSRAD